MKHRIFGGLILTAGLTVTAMAQWSEPVNMSGSRDGTDPSLTIDSARTLHAAWSWQTFNPPLFDWIDYTCKSAGVDTWTLPVHASRDSYPLRVSVVVIGPGHVPHIVWQSEAEPGYIYITHRGGDTWTTPERLTGWNGWGSGIRAATDRFGRIHTTWTDLTWDYLWYARYDENGWAGPETVAFDTTPYALGASDIVADRYGRPHLLFFWRDSLAYSVRTETGWTEPVFVPTLYEKPAISQITLDTCGRPHVVCEESPYQISHTYWTGDSWATPVRLDSIKGFIPAICCDSWNRIHVVFSEESLGVRERVFHEGRWVENALVDSWEGLEKEVVAERARLHLLWRKAYIGRVWYSWRPLEPPGITGDDAGSGFEVVSLCPNPVVPSAEMAVWAPRCERVTVRVLDVTGRVVGSSQARATGAGEVRLRPYGLLPGAGVFYCRVESGRRRMVVKLVRTE
ncbi:MAG: hypothetical protein ABIK44_04670 [candidate division WOR-3 bacterium]